MVKKKKTVDLEEYQRIKNEIIFDKVNEIFREQPDNYHQKLEDIGITYYDDDDTEEAEEDKAIPQTENQEYLLRYFEGHHPLSTEVLQVYLKERVSEKPNYPLIRRYFRKANAELKALLLYGLDHIPTSIDLLDDLTYFHEFSGILDELVNRYITACQIEHNLMKFSELAMDFYYATAPDGFNALSELKKLFASDMEKGGNIEFIISELSSEGNKAEDIQF